MTDSELHSQYAGYSDQQLAELIASGIPDWQAEQCRRLLKLRRLEHYLGQIDTSSPPPLESSEHYLGQIDTSSPPPLESSKPDKQKVGQIDTSSPPPLESSKPDKQKVVIAAAKSRVLFVLFVILGLILGSLGIHNYYAGYLVRGTIQLLLTLLYGWRGLIVTVPWALIEIFVVTSDSSGAKMT
jgi:TM2 domain-containing membrane protein YozV